MPGRFAFIEIDDAMAELRHKRNFLYTNTYLVR